MSRDLLRVENLRVAFGHGRSRQEVVNGVSFAIRENETLALVGESGSGKSVSALACVGLIGARGGTVLSGSSRFARADGGQVDFLNPGQANLRRMRALEVGMVFQDPMTSLNPLFRIGDQISEAARLHQGISRQRARTLTVEMLEKVRIPRPELRARQYPHELSGGMRQRAMIAMALSCSPRLLIADEPTTALDVTVQAEILSLIKELQQEIGTAILFISHDLSVVSQVSDRVIIMQEGWVVEEGTTSRILSKPQHEYTRMLLAAVPVLGSTAGSAGPVRIGASLPGGTAQDAGCSIGAMSGPEPKILLRVKELKKSYSTKRLFSSSETVHAVQGVDFDIAQGQTLSLVGESGCGKTTTGRCILQLDRPDGGIVEFDGRSVLGLSTREINRLRREMQIVFQDPFASLNPRKRAGEIIGEPLYIHDGIDGEELVDRVEELVRKVGLLPEHMFRYPHEFSGGQRQRIGIARAISLKPRLIVADEPVSALDVSIQAQIVNLLIDLQEEFSMSYLFISHDMAIVERVSHRVAVMQRGRIVEIGARDSVLNDPRHEYTRGLISAVPSIDMAGSSRIRVKNTGHSPRPTPETSAPRDRYELVGAGGDHYFAVGGGN